MNRPLLGAAKAQAVSRAGRTDETTYVYEKEATLFVRSLTEGIPSGARLIAEAWPNGTLVDLEAVP